MCSECGWVDHHREFAEWIALKQLFKGFGMLVVFVVLIAFLVQMILWRQFSLEASFLLAKKGLQGPKIPVLMQLGAICNSLEDFKCSTRYFRQVVEQNPSDQQALANLAMGLSRLGQWKRARSHYQAYFSLGGNGFDALLWYGKTLAELEDPSQGLDWYYFALAVNPQYDDGAKLLVDELVKMKRYHEALSVIGAMTGGEPVRDIYWSDQENAIVDRLDTNGPHFIPESLRFPSWVGQAPYAPVRVSPKGRVLYFVINPSFRWVVINQDVVDESRIYIPPETEEVELPTVGGGVKAKKITLGHFQVGPWVFENQEVLFCEGCPAQIGNSLLTELDLHKWQKNRIDFVELRRPTRDLAQEDSEREPQSVDTEASDETEEDPHYHD